MVAFQAPAQAQGDDDMGVIEVTAPRITGDAQRPFGTGMTRVINKKAEVNAADLNLERSSHMVILEGRVRNAAENVCEALEEEVPFGQPSAEVCAQRAVADTMARVRDTLSSDSA
jgi:UrcA family protein